MPHLRKVDPEGRPLVAGWCSKWCIKCGRPHEPGWIEEREEASRSLLARTGRAPSAAYPNGGIICAVCFLGALHEACTEVTDPTAERAGREDG